MSSLYRDSIRPRGDGATEGCLMCDWVLMRYCSSFQGWFSAFWEIVLRDFTAAEKSAERRINVIFFEMNEAFIGVVATSMHVCIYSRWVCFCLLGSLSVGPIKQLCGFFIPHCGFKAHFVVKLPLIPLRLHLMTAADQKSLSGVLFDPLISLKFLLHTPYLAPPLPLFFSSTNQLTRFNSRVPLHSPLPDLLFALENNLTSFEALHLKSVFTLRCENGSWRRERAAFKVIYSGEAPLTSCSLVISTPPLKINCFIQTLSSLLSSLWRSWHMDSCFLLPTRIRVYWHKWLQFEGYCSSQQKEKWKNGFSLGVLVVVEEEKPQQILTQVNDYSEKRRLHKTDTIFHPQST